MTKSCVEMAGKTDTGCVRERNEDSFALDPELGLAVVADGMGGHNSGEVASALATETILEFARRLLGGPAAVMPEGGSAGMSARARQLEHCIQGANTMIWEKARAFPKDHGMGTTVVAALADGKTLTVGHVGDSRLYLYRDGRIQALTVDHSLVMDQVKHGLITPEQAEKSHLQNILTRALGTEESVAVDIEEHPMRPGDVYLLCSDGLTKMVPEPEIARSIEENGSPEEMADRLIQKARKAGGVDNITVALLRVARGKRAWRGLFSKLLRK